jgi:hypothetical protein
LPHGGNDARRNADEHGDQHRQHGELHRDRQLLQDQIQDRLLAADRIPEVAAQDAADPVQIPDRQRLVQVHPLAQIGDDLRILFFAGEDHRRVARQQLLQPEDEHRHEDQRRQDRRDSPDEVSGHILRAPS